MNPLRRLSEEHGQSPWLDNLKRGYLTSGQLAALRDRGIRGLTSNPTIFQKAIQGSSDYDEQFKTLALDDHPIVDDYWQLVIADIHGACDVFSRLRPHRRPRRLRQRRGRSGVGQRLGGDRSGGAEPSRADQAAQPDGEDPGDRGRRRRRSSG